jgi:hypothetical protein
MWSGRTSQSHASMEAPLPSMAANKLMQNQKQEDLLCIQWLLSKHQLDQPNCRETRCCYWERASIYGHMSQWTHRHRKLWNSLLQESSLLCAGLPFLLGDKGKIMFFVGPTSEDYSFPTQTTIDRRCLWITLINP